MAYFEIPVPGLKPGQKVPVRVGNAVKRVIGATIGIEPCDECEERQEWLNGLVALRGRRRRRRRR